MKVIKIIKNKKGITLIEIIISLSLCSIITMATLTMLKLHLKDYHYVTTKIGSKLNLINAMDIIEKNIRGLNLVNIKYDEHLMKFESYKLTPVNNNINEYVILNGKYCTSRNVLLYYRKSLKQLRTNINNEQNVVARHIKTVNVKKKSEKNIYEIFIEDTMGNSEIRLLNLGDCN